MGNKTNRCGGIMKDNGIVKAAANGAMSGSLKKNRKESSESFAVAPGGTGYEKPIPRLGPKKLATDKGSFDIKSEKPKNKRNFTKNNYEHLADNPHNRAANKNNPVKGSVLYNKYASGKGGADKVLRGTTPGHFSMPERIQA